MKFSLPDKVSKPLTDLGSYSLLIFGREKIGKTDLAAQFPEAFFLMCEPGGKGLRIFQRPVTTWIQYKKYVGLLNEEANRFKTVVTDTIDLAFKMCVRHVCRNLGVLHVSEEKWGKAYDMIRDEFAEQMQALISTPGRGVIFISHEEDKTLESKKNGEEKSRIIPTMPKQARKVIEPMIDIWGYYHYGDDGKRWLRIRGNKFISAGCRLKENFVGVNKIPMGDSAKEGYQNFVQAFNSTKKEETKSIAIKIRRK